jgi:excisionase family DNA binding protein
MTQLLNVADAARLLALSPWTIRAYVRDGKLLPLRIGRRVLFEETELQRFVAQARTK